jgi:GTP-binding protein
MSNPNFIDYVKMYCKSGHGGAGSAHLRREKFIPKGGPDGGDGGRGGHIIVKGSRNKWTLLHLKYTKHVKAGKGGEGGPQRSSGAMGKDRILEVPLGAVMKDADTGVVICEVTREGETHIVLRGGRGGLGNDHFKTSTNQTPRYAQPGEEGIEKAVKSKEDPIKDPGLLDDRKKR